MSPLLSFLAAHKAISAVVVGLVVVVPTAGVAMTGGQLGTAAVVQRVIDGDTVDVTYEGSTHRIRLLNVDTPETGNPAKPVQCMGLEAVKFLRKRLPQGKAVRLRFDRERSDRDQRELAGVFADDELVNAEIARAGLGAAVLYEPNDRYYEKVVKAQEEAERRQVGLYSPKLKCTLPAQVAQLEQVGSRLTAASASSTADLKALQQRQNVIRGALTKSQKLTALLNDPSGHFDGQTYRAVLHEDLTRRVNVTALLLTQAGTEAKSRADRIAQVKAEQAKQQARAKAERAKAERAAARAAAKRAKAKKAAARAAAKRAAERAEARAERRAAERKAEKSAEREAEQAAEREAEQKAEQAAEQAERDDERVKAQKAEASRQKDTTPETSTQNNSDSSKADTECRAYVNDGTSVDSKGRRYNKISC